jgi:hypothetical protein
VAGIWPFVPDSGERGRNLTILTSFWLVWQEFGIVQLDFGQFSQNPTTVAGHRCDINFKIPALTGTGIYFSESSNGRLFKSEGRLCCLKYGRLRMPSKKNDL